MFSNHSPFSRWPSALNGASFSTDNWNPVVGPSEVTNDKSKDGKYLCVADMGLTDKDMQDITGEWQKTVLAVQTKLSSHSSRSVPAPTDRKTWDFCGCCAYQIADEGQAPVKSHSALPASGPSCSEGDVGGGGPEARCGLWAARHGHDHGAKIEEEKSKRTGGERRGRGGVEGRRESRPQSAMELRGGCGAKEMVRPLSTAPALPSLWSRAGQDRRNAPRCRRPPASSGRAPPVGRAWSDSCRHSNC